MTSGRDAIPDSLCDELPANRSGPPVMESAAVIGLFDHFNRFADALCIPVTR